MGKGSSGGGVQESVVTQTNLPEYAEPFFQELLGRTVYESTRPYEAFPGQRIAEFDPFEQYGMQGMAEMAAAEALNRSLTHRTLPLMWAFKMSVWAWISLGALGPRCSIQGIVLET